MIASTRMAASSLALLIPLGLALLLAIFEPRILHDQLFIVWFIVVPLLLAAIAFRWHLIGGILMGILGTYGLGLVGVMGNLALISIFVLAFLATGFLHVLFGLTSWLTSGVREPAPVASAMVGRARAEQVSFE